MTELLGRDPRNDAHIKRAYDIIKDCDAIHVLESTATDLRAAGIALPPKVKIRKRVHKTNLAVGLFFLLERGLVYPDNVLLPCHGCGATLQFRPNLGHSVAIHLCIFCAADRVLNAS